MTKRPVQAIAQSGLDTRSSPGATPPTPRATSISTAAPARMESRYLESRVRDPPRHKQQPINLSLQISIRRGTVHLTLPFSRCSGPGNLKAPPYQQLRSPSCASARSRRRGHQRRGGSGIPPSWYYLAKVDRDLRGQVLHLRRSRLPPPAAARPPAHPRRYHLARELTAQKSVEEPAQINPVADHLGYLLRPWRLGSGSGRHRHRREKGYYFILPPLDAGVGGFPAP